MQTDLFKIRIKHTAYMKTSVPVVKNKLLLPHDLLVTT